MNNACVQRWRFDPLPSLWKLDQFDQFCFNSLTKEEGWNRIEEYVQYQDELWDDLSPPMNVSSILEAMQPTFRGRLKRACNQISYLETPAQKNNDTPPWWNNKRKEKGEDGPEWTIRSRFEDELANFMFEKKSHTKAIGEMLDQHHKEFHEQFSQILSTIRKSKTPKPEATTFAITTRSGVSTKDPPFPSPSQLTSSNHTEGQLKKKGLRTQDQASYKNLPLGHPSFTNLPSRPTLPFRPRFKKAEKG
ncbi:hypothetical protein Tco_0364157 [Tanacetum coccineum]